MSTSGNKFFDDLTNAYSEAAKKNADTIKQGFDLWRDTVNLPYNLSRIIAEGSSTLSKGFADYLRLNVEHASHLLDLGRTLSSELLSSLEKSGWQTKTSSETQPQQAQTVSELHLSGYPGDLCRSAFVLESRKSANVLARVFHSRFINRENNAPVTIPVNLDPSEATVAPDEKIRIAFEAGIPEDLPPGNYQSMVWIEGFPELSLRVLLNVAEGKMTETEPQKNKKNEPGKARPARVKPK
jgi:hypothetical protein